MKHRNVPGLRRFRPFILVLSLLVMMSAFVACGNKLDGSYRSDSGMSETITFKGNTITLSAFGINTSGTYKIEGKKISIEYKLFGFGTNVTWDFEQKGDSIFIQGMEFKKIK